MRTIEDIFTFFLGSITENCSKSGGAHSARPTLYRDGRFYALSPVNFDCANAQKTCIYVLNCPHLPLQPYGIVFRRLTHLLVSNRMQTIPYGCRSNSEQEDIYTGFRPSAPTQTHPILTIWKNRFLTICVIDFFVSLDIPFTPITKPNATLFQFDTNSFAVLILFLIIIL